MPTNTRFHSVDFALKANGTLIGAGRGLLSRSAEIQNPIPQTEDYWMRSHALVRDGQVQITELQYLEGAGTPAEIEGSTVVLTCGGTALKGVRQIDFNISADNPIMTDVDDALDQARLPGVRSSVLDVSGNYYDPGSTNGAAYGAVEDAYQAGTSIAHVLTFGSAQSYTFTSYVSSLEGPVKGGNERVMFSYSAATSGSVTMVNTNADGGLAAILDSILHATKPQTITALVTNSTTGDIEYTGSVYPSAFNISIPYDGLVSSTGTLVLAASGFTDSAVST